jgi:hypothetical protein
MGKPNGAADILKNPTWEQMLEQDPIVAFSFYLSGRKNVLLRIADEITESLDHAFAETVVDGSRFERAESLMWMWTLGAYEVVRTMCQAKECFSPNALEALAQLKKGLSSIRMPAAKMEKPGKKVPVISDRSPACWDIPNKDILINDPESTPDVSARSILRQFKQVFSAITRADVLGRHEDSYITKHARKDGTVLH